MRILSKRAIRAPDGYYKLSDRFEVTRFIIYEKFPRNRLYRKIRVRREEKIQDVMILVVTLIVANMVSNLNLSIIHENHKRIYASNTSISISF